MIIIKTIFISIIILIFSFILKKIFSIFIFKLICSIINKTKSKLDDKIIKSFEKPIQWLIIVIGIYFSMKNISILILNDDLFKSFLLFNSKLFKSLVAILICSGFYNMEDASSIIFDRITNNLNIKINTIIIPFISKFLRFLTIAITFCIILEEWGYDINGFIAGLGLGGLAFALAAKETIANIFAGIVIVIDQSFSIGDLIETPKVHGIVEDINFRVTRVRTLDQGLVTIPNSTLANDIINNLSKRTKRRINFYLQIKKNTQHTKIEKLVKEIKDYLINQGNVIPDTITVCFDRISENSFDILINFQVDTSDWNEYILVKQNLNFKLISVLNKENIQLSIPIAKTF